MTAERLLPWYILSCALPYLPYLAARAGLFQDWGGLVALVVGLLAAGAIGVANLIAGPLLFRRLSGGRRLAVALAYPFGAVLPTAVIVALFLE